MKIKIIENILSIERKFYKTLHRMAIGPEVQLAGLPTKDIIQNKGNSLKKEAFKLNILSTSEIVLMHDAK